MPARGRSLANFDWDWPTALMGNPDFPIERVIEKLCVLMPRVNVILSEADPLTIERQILSRQLHAGIHAFPNHAPGLRYLKLFMESQSLYCGQGHPLFPIADSDITADTIEKSKYAARSYYGGKLKPGSLHPRPSTATASTMDGILALILSGNFIGHLPMQTANRWLDAGTIRPILPRVMSYDTLFECAFANGTRIARQIEVFEKVLSSYCAKGSASSRASDSN
ncbi:substrate-binding domain-containing protein [Rhizobium beringeri]